MPSLNDNLSKEKAWNQLATEHLFKKVIIR